MGSPAHEEIKKILLQSTLVKDMKQLSKGATTTTLVIFHALKIRYLPKSIFFEKEKMIALTKVAVMDHNINVDREQVRQYTNTQLGIGRTKVRYIKSLKRLPRISIANQFLKSSFAP